MPVWNVNSIDRTNCDYFIHVRTHAWKCVREREYMCSVLEYGIESKRMEEGVERKHCLPYIRIDILHYMRKMTAPNGCRRERKSREKNEQSKDNERGQENAADIALFTFFISRKRSDERDTERTHGRVYIALRRECQMCV